MMAQQMHEAALALTFTRVPRQGRCERKRQKKEKKKIPKADGPGPLDSELRLQRIDVTDEDIALSPINDQQALRARGRQHAVAKSKAISSMAHAENKESHAMQTDAAEEKENNTSEKP